MTSYEREYYFNVEKIKESLESIAHSLEIIAETNIKINADIDSEELFEQEESYVPYPEVEDSYDNSDYDGDN